MPKFRYSNIYIGNGKNACIRNGLLLFRLQVLFFYLPEKKPEIVIRNGLNSRRSRNQVCRLPV
jgi:hypothetical protein